MYAGAFVGTASEDIRSSAPKVSMYIMSILYAIEQEFSSYIMAS